MPKVQFKEGSYKVDESDGEVTAIVYRSGDINLRSTVRCYTRQGSAQVMMDYSERPNTDASIVTFLPGETSHTAKFLCTSISFSAYLSMLTIFLQVKLRSHVWLA